MKILVESGNQSHDNLGDLAMLQVAVQRVRELWPGCGIGVVTRQPDRLRHHIPEAEPVALPFGGWLERYRSSEGIAPVRTMRPLLSSLGGLLSRLPPLPLPPSLRDALAEADLVILSGSGILADPFRGPAMARLRLLLAAQRGGKPTALFSQGLGPLNDARLLAAAGQILPPAKLIAVRERLYGLELLAAMNVARERVAVTGDDSLQLALDDRHEDQQRTDLGFNLRLAPYAGNVSSSSKFLEALNSALASFLREESCPLRPLSIHRQDYRQLKRAAPEIVRRFDLPPHRHEIGSLLRATARCRVVIAGSYHAAVFALGQGKPAICLARSEYYQRKFAGLADLFPEGCLIPDFSSPHAFDELAHHLQRLWDEADEIRPTLLRSARAQVEWSRAAYQRLEILL